MADIKEISYKNVYYFGADKQNLRFEDLVIDGKSYGNMLISITTKLGAILFNYCIKKEHAIEVENTGTDGTIILDYNNSAEVIRRSGYEYLDQIARGQGYMSGADCVSYISSTNSLKAHQAKLYRDWRDECIQIIEDTTKAAKNGEIKDYDIDYLISKLPQTPIFESDVEINDPNRIVYEDVVKEMSLEDLKLYKLSELTNVGHQYDANLVNDNMAINTSLGFLINADLRSQNNLQGLINAEVSPVAYSDYNGEIHELTTEDLKTLLKECVLNNQNIYQQKWAYKKQILACPDKDKLQALQFEFEMLDFSSNS